MRGDIEAGEVYQGGGNSGAVLSLSDVYRFALWRSWSPGLPCAVFVMLNPSTADAAVNDHTIRKCIGFAKRWECGGIYVVNLFAYRATKPRNLPKTEFAREGPGNARHQLRALSRLCAPNVIPGPCVVAWGSQPKRILGNAPKVLRAMGGTVEAPLQCLGTAKDGNPRHPLMLAYDTPLRPWGND